jgi:hypothetical protein
MLFDEMKMSVQRSLVMSSSCCPLVFSPSASAAMMSIEPISGFIKANNRRKIKGGKVGEILDR